ncbi:MAG: hypothetical protein ACTSP4_07930 [Candidatus Hodarchaeales archaeon]
MNPTELRKKGMEALVEALGPVGMVRFLQQFETGKGDYTLERKKWLNKTTIDDVIRDIKKQKQD